MSAVYSVFVRCFILLVLGVCFGCRSSPHQGPRDESAALQGFIADRIAAASLLGEYPGLGDKLRVALVRSIDGYRIAWSNEEPRSGAPAEHSAHQDLGTIQIRVSANLHPADQIVGLFYEALNAQRFREFVKTVEEAKVGKLSREEFIDRIVRVEHKAIVLLKVVCQSAFVLPADVEGGTTLYRAILASPTDPSTFMSWRRSRPEYARTAVLYGGYFDVITGEQ
jgi:hypothetical protein